jgi:glycosyltransferase involved in cell wall biosynthesis
MKLLYVSSLWSGLTPLLFEGADESAGMPAFVEPLKQLLKAGHEVSVIFIHKRAIQELNIRASWLKGVRMCFVDRASVRGRGARHRLLDRAVQSEIERCKPDFVYLQGTTPAFLWKRLNKMGIPCGQRIYGVDDFNLKFKGMPRALIRFLGPESWEALSGRKAFVVATQDGSRADLALQRVNPGHGFEFHHLLNGFVSPSDCETPKSTIKIDGAFLFCPARFAVMKDKARTVDFLKQMHARGLTEMKLVVAGQKTDQKEWDRFWKRASDLGIRDSIEYLGEVSRDTIRELCYAASAVLSLYRFSNVSNVTIETLSGGGLLVAREDAELHELLNGFDCCLMGADLDALSGRLVSTLLEPSGPQEYRAQARAWTEARLMDWPARAAIEISLIERSV